MEEPADVLSDIEGAVQEAVRLRSAGKAAIREGDWALAAVSSEAAADLALGATLELLALYRARLQQWIADLSPAKKPQTRPGGEGSEC